MRLDSDRQGYIKFRPELISWSGKFITSGYDPVIQMADKKQV